MDLTLPLAIVCLLSFTGLLFLLSEGEQTWHIKRHKDYEIKRLTKGRK
jgi:hypothetical protein